MPLRVFIKNYPNVIQKRAKLSDDNGPVKLGDYLKTIFPNLKFHWDTEVEEGQKKYNVISQGILLEPDYPLTFLSENLYALDGFVYISLHYD